MEFDRFKSLETGKQEIFIRFHKSEKKSIISASKRRISDLKRMRERVYNNPRNEGQSDYIERASELSGDIEFFEELIELLS
jgi:hypothetical protein